MLVNIKSEFLVISFNLKLKKKKFFKDLLECIILLFLVSIKLIDFLFFICFYIS